MPTQPKPLESLPNIGKKIAAKLRKIGIKDADEFMKRDPYEVFTELLLKDDPSLCRCALSAIVGAREGMIWHKIHKKTSEEYLKRYPSHQWMNRC